MRRWSLFSIAVVFVTALLAGLAPALLSMRADLVSQLRSGGRGVTGSAATRGRRTLVVAQVALAVTIVAAAGLLIRSVLRLQSVDLGLACRPSRAVGPPHAAGEIRGARPARAVPRRGDRAARRPYRPSRLRRRSTCRRSPVRGGICRDSRPRDRATSRPRRIPRSTSSRFTRTISRRSRCRSCADARSRPRIARAPWRWRSSAKTSRRGPGLETTRLASG